MKTLLKLTVIAAALALTLDINAIHAAPQDAARGVTETRAVGAFSAIELDGPYHVVIQAHGKNALELSGERAELADIETGVRGDTLIVRGASRNIFHFSIGKRREPATIRITAEALKSVKLGGSGDVEIEQLNTDRLALGLDGPGDLHASGAVRELAVSSSGSGDIDLRRMALVNVSVKMSGPGDVKLSGVSGELSAEVRGSGDLKAEALRLTKATAQMHGPGNVALSGVSGELRAVISGSGDLEAGGLAVRNATIRSHGPGNAILATVTDTLDAEMSGSGDLTAALAAKRLLLKMNGPGDARIEGSVAQVNAQLGGSGNLSARRLVAGRADVVVNGPGEAVINVQSKAGAGSTLASAARVITIDRSGTRQSRE